MPRQYIVAPSIYKPGSFLTKKCYHAVKIDNLVITTGLVGATPDGETPSDFRTQCHQLWKNILSVISAAGANPEHIVNAVTYHTDPKNVKVGTEIRDMYLQEGIPPIGVLTVVKELAYPDLLIEVQITAIIE